MHRKAIFRRTPVKRDAKLVRQKKIVLNQVTVETNRKLIAALSRIFILNYRIEFIQIIDNAFADVSIRLRERRVREFYARRRSSFAALDDFLLERYFADYIDVHIAGEVVDCVVVEDILVTAVFTDHV